MAAAAGPKRPRTGGFDGPGWRPDPSAAAARLQQVAPSRMPVICPKAAVACSQPLAAEAGLQVLRRGGNAVDAAIAVTAALAVTEPCSTGMGGDAFLLFYDSASQTVHAANGSGRAPEKLTREHIISKLGLPADAAEISPASHALCVTVPGAVGLWCDALERWGSGKVSRADVLGRAAELAEEGFPVAPVCAAGWQASEEDLRKASDNCGEILMADPAAPGGRRAPAAGEWWKNPGAAAVLRRIGAEGKAAFYSGAVAEAICAEVQSHGGVLSTADLAAHTTTWPAAISCEYGGVRVWEHPPNGQGVTALVALNILTALERKGAVSFSRGTLGTADHIHTQIEALRLAFADARHYVCDPDKGSVPLEWLLSEQYAAERAAAIDPRGKAMADVRHGQPPKDAHTVSFQVVDAEGNAVSMVNSNYMGFGTGLVPKGCGFTLQNRGHNFSLTPGHPNCVAPGKRPYHTIIPCITTLPSGELHMTMTNMGGFMQPQGHLQHLVNMLRCGMDPQQSIDAPRFCILNDAYSGISGVVGVEENLVDERTAAELRARGHNLQVVTGGARGLFGRAQIIVRAANGALWAGSDGRADGCAIGY
eukprot:TRINITY_DN8074_c0_g1_i1.p1 TRINITY_DN8074_c0_g1~~TRINITY_DN8074_c0_g1_i1.p1  ORF type:complete len:617 (+),score=186.87 TRINITY_DN8074_c0_g1_i1:74-1852(+)